MDIEISFQPKQKQLAELLFQTGPDVPTTIGFGGARGGGKSKTIRNCTLAALDLAYRYPGLIVMIMRRVWDDVKVNHLDEFLREYPILKDWYNVQDHEIRLPESRGSAKIKFNYAETEADVNRKFWGPQYPFLFVDQAEQFSAAELQMIKTANRWPGVPPGFCKTLLCFNPGGGGSKPPIGLSYLRRVFWLKQYEDQERPGDYHFIQAYGWDNFEWFRAECGLTAPEFYKLDNETRFRMFIERTSEGRKMNAMPASIRAGHLLGSFDHFEGQYYAGVWDERKCVLSRDQVLRLAAPWWKRWCSFDWGFANYSVCLWFTAGKLSPDQLAEIGVQSAWPLDVVIVYREMAVNRLAEAEVAERIVAMTPPEERREIKNFIADTQVFDTDRKNNNTIADLMEPILRAGGMPRMEGAAKGPGSRVSGWRQLHDGFRRSSMLRSSNPPEDTRGGPLLLVSADCPQLCAAIPLLVSDPKHPEDVYDTQTIEQDIGDALRYGTKDALDPKTEAPVHVRRAEVAASVEPITQKMLRLRQFDVREKQRSGVFRAHRSR